MRKWRAFAPYPMKNARELGDDRRVVSGIIFVTRRGQDERRNQSFWLQSTSPGAMIARRASHLSKDMMHVFNRRQALTSRIGPIPENLVSENVAQDEQRGMIVEWRGALCHAA